jgi:DNA polymerase III epsilon subunit-like protein
VGFDIAMIKHAFAYCKKDMTKYFSSNNKEIVSVDTLQIARFVWGVKSTNTDESWKLGKCCERAGIELFDAHGAMSDVVATLELVRYYSRLGNNVVGAKEKETDTKTKSRHFFKI